MRNRYHNQDPYWTIARYNSKDRQGNPVSKGTKIFYYPACRTVLQGEAAEQAAGEFAATCFDEENYQGRN